MATTNQEGPSQLLIDAVNLRKKSLVKNKYTAENQYKAPDDSINVGQIVIR